MNTPTLWSALCMFPPAPDLMREGGLLIVAAGVCGGGGAEPPTTAEWRWIPERFGHVGPQHLSSDPSPLSTLAVLTGGKGGFGGRAPESA